MNFTKTNLDMSLTREQIKNNFNQLIKESSKNVSKQSFIGIFFNQYAVPNLNLSISNIGKQSYKFEEQIGSSVLHLENKRLEVKLIGAYNETRYFTNIGFNEVNTFFKINILKKKKIKCIQM